MSSRPTSAYDPNYYKKDRRTSLETSFVMEETFFMLIADTVVSIISGDSSMIRTVLRSNEKQFLKGSMFKAYIPYDASKSSPYKIMVRPVEEDPMFCECERVALTPISKEEKDMLMALADCGTRYRVYRDRNRMLEALQIEEGSLVLVSTRNLIRPSCGIVRYKGMVSSMPGIYFGIELTENRNSCSTDGLFRGKQHFKCEKNCALFVTVDKIIRLLHSVKLEIGPGSKVFVFLTEDDERKHLEPGTVKYIGTPKGWQGVHVGIELVKPVGNKDGYHGNDKLFHSKRDHALIVPLGSAMPENKIDTKHVNRFRRDMAYTRETSASGTNHEKYQSNVPIKSESSLSVLNSTSKELGQSSEKTLKEQQEMMCSFEEKKQNSNVVPELVIKNNHWDDEPQADARSPTPGEGSQLDFQKPPGTAGGESERDQLQKEIQGLREELKASRDEAKSNEERLNSMVQSLTTELKEKSQSYSKSLSELENDIQVKVSQEELLRREVNDLKQQLEVKTSIEKKLSKEISDLEELVSKSQSETELCLKFNLLEQRQQKLENQVSDKLKSAQEKSELESHLIKAESELHSKINLLLIELKQQQEVLEKKTNQHLEVQVSDKLKSAESELHGKVNFLEIELRKQQEVLEKKADKELKLPEERPEVEAGQVEAESELYSKINLLEVELKKQQEVEKDLKQELKTQTDKEWKLAKEKSKLEVNLTKFKLELLRQVNEGAAAGTLHSEIEDLHSQADMLEGQIEHGELYFTPTELQTVCHRINELHENVSTDLKARGLGELASQIFYFRAATNLLRQISQPGFPMKQTPPSDSGHKSPSQPVPPIQEAPSKDTQTPPLESGHNSPNQPVPPAQEAPSKDTQSV